ncbi:MAG: geranylgeranylglycerol-phosphate geranylgeranyltransferase [Methanoregulaceae archaeon]|nr:geranylgeranylglycerol-phosphate geranylgeranyltransferase [Methanoregulaceae archaeon]
MKTPGIVRITRPLNSVVAGLAAVLAFLIATGTVTLASLILIPIVTLITAAGNVVNDIYDIGIDKINRPERPLPSGETRLGTAKIFAALLFITGITICTFTNPLCLVIAIFNSAILILYASNFKKTMFLGNVAVSYLSASIFLFGGAFSGIEGLIANFSITGITFLAMMAREVLKDAEDIDGDAAAGGRTLPIAFGIQKSSFIAIFFAVFAIIASILPVLRWGIWYIAGIAIADIVILTGALRPFRCHTSACVRNTCATTYIKVGMFVALGVFTFSALVF